MVDICKPIRADFICSHKHKDTAEVHCTHSFMNLAVLRQRVWWENITCRNVAKTIRLCREHVHKHRIILFFHLSVLTVFPSLRPSLTVSFWLFPACLLSHQDDLHLLMPWPVSTLSNTVRPWYKKAVQPNLTQRLLRISTIPYTGLSKCKPFSKTADLTEACWTIWG